MGEESNMERETGRTFRLDMAAAVRTYQGNLTKAWELYCEESNRAWEKYEKTREGG